MSLARPCHQVVVQVGAVSYERTIPTANASDVDLKRVKQRIPKHCDHHKKGGDALSVDINCRLLADNASSGHGRN